MARKQHKTHPDRPTRQLDGDQAAESRAYRRFLLIVAMVLLGLGLYHSIHFYGHRPFPHADSPYFIRTGHELLHFQTPSTFKRAPVVGLAQALISYVIPVANSDLHAGWLLNALLHPVTVLLFWLVGRRLLGDFPAVAFAILAAVNPCLLMRLTESIAETSLVCATLATFYLLYRGSRWAYLLAAITSMIRYEGAILIAIVWVADLLRAGNNRQRLFTLVRAAGAALPLGLWLLGTKLTWQPGQSHYLAHYGGKTFHFAKYLTLIWQVSTAPLLRYVSASESAFTATATRICQVLTVVLALAGAVFGLRRYRGLTLPLIIFVVGYCLIHMLRDSLRERYYAPTAWITLLLCGLGVRGMVAAGQYLLKNRLPLLKWLAAVAAVVVVIAALMWAASMFELFGRLKEISPAAISVPYVAGAVGLLSAVLYMRVAGMRRLVQVAPIVAVVVLGLICNQSVLAIKMATARDHEGEFVQLLQWYRDNAQPREKLLTTLASPIRLMASDIDPECFPHTAYVADGSSDPVLFTKECLGEGIEYVAWDSRIGRAVGNSYYKRWHIEKTRMLAGGKSVSMTDPLPSRENPRPPVIAHYRYIRTFKQGYRYIHLYRLSPVTRQVGP